MSRSIDELFDEVARTDDLATYAVLADALVERGDPRGELMQLQVSLDGAAYDPGLPPWPRTFAKRTEHDRVRDERPAKLDDRTAATLNARVKALSEARLHALLGELPAYHGFQLEYRYGILDRVRVRFTTLDPRSIAEHLARVFASPEARRLQILELDPGSRIPSDWYRTLFTELAKLAPVAASLRSVVCGSLFPGSDYQYSPGEDPVDNHAAALAAFPGLEELWLHIRTVEIDWPPLASPSLRHLTFVTPSIRAGDLAAFAAADLPALSSFVMWTGASHYVNEKDDMNDTTPARCHGLDDLAPVFAMLDRCPELRLLGVGNYIGDVAELVRAIAAHPVGQRIETLDLSFADSVDGTRLPLDLLPALREVVIDGTDVRGQTAITKGGRRLVGGYTYGLDRFRYVVHQE